MLQVTWMGLYYPPTMLMKLGQNVMALSSSGYTILFQKISFTALSKLEGQLTKSGSILKPSFAIRRRQGPYSSITSSVPRRSVTSPSMPTIKSLNRLLISWLTLMLRSPNELWLHIFSMGLIQSMTTLSMLSSITSRHLNKRGRCCFWRRIE